MRIGALTQAPASGRWSARSSHTRVGCCPLWWLLVLAAVAVAVGVCLVAWLLHGVFLIALDAFLGVLPVAIANSIVFVLALLAGGTMAALVAYLVGMPLLRLGSDYFGIATLGFAIMMYTALQNSDLVIATMKGARGMVGIPRWTNWGLGVWGAGALG